MQLLNEMTPEERVWREKQKRFCSKCRRWVRERTDQRMVTILWNGEQLFPPRRFVNARMRAIEETWNCPQCPAVRDGVLAGGMWIDFEHVGQPEEIIGM
jgi:hypothetical protein